MTVRTDIDRPQLALEESYGTFEKIVVGVEDSEAALEATRQAAALLAPHGLLTLLTTYQVLPTAGGLAGWGSQAYAYQAPEIRKQIQEQAVKTLQKAREIVHEVDAHELVEGKTKEEAAANALIAEAARIGADLIAVGAPHHGRAWGFLSGSCATAVLHNAPCSVLVARPLAAGVKRIVVGIDGSPASRLAFNAAAALAAELGAELGTLAAYGGRALDLDAVKAINPDYEHSAYDAVTALIGRSSDCDLLVVGSRGLEGLRALGSVSERVAHEAACSVLVVRSPEPSPCV